MSVWIAVEWPEHVLIVTLRTEALLSAGTTHSNLLSLQSLEITQGAGTDVSTDSI